MFDAVLRQAMIGILCREFMAGGCTKTPVVLLATANLKYIIKRNDSVFLAGWASCENWIALETKHETVSQLHSVKYILFYSDFKCNPSVPVSVYLSPFFWPDKFPWGLNLKFKTFIF